MSRPRMLVIDGVQTTDTEPSDLYFWVDENQEGILTIVLRNAASETKNVIFEADFMRIA